MRKLCLFLMVLAAAGLFASELCAQNNPVYFPYVVNDGSTVTELLFTNTTTRDASLTLTGYQEDGTAVAGPALAVPGKLSGCGQFIQRVEWLGPCGEQRAGSCRQRARAFG